jgi:RNA-directed DNA polymerase
LHHLVKFCEVIIISSFLNITNIDEIKSLLDYSDIKAIRGYNTFDIKNTNSKKERTIHSPNSKLKDVQQQLAKILQKVYRTPKSVHGYVTGKNIKSNALAHVHNNIIYSTDIENFFPTIHFGRVKKLFMSIPFNFNTEVASEIARIVIFKNMLPQGAPTSPIISNMICLKLDKQLLKIAKEYHISYSRYADDITFSTNRKILIEKVIPLIENAIESNGFKLNIKKTKMVLKGNSQKVTGLKINEFVNVDRKYINHLQSQLFAWNKFGYEEAKNDFLDKYYFKHRGSGKRNSEFINVIYGRLIFLKYIRSEDNPIYIKLAKKFNKLFIRDLQLLTNIKNINKLTYNDKSCFDEKLFVIDFLPELDTNGNPSQDGVDNQTGTGFIIKSFPYLITCNHVVSQCKGSSFKYDGKIKIINSDLKEELVELVEVDDFRDIAILELPNFLKNKYTLYNSSLDVSAVNNILQSNKIEYYGFPDYNYGDKYSKTNGIITNIRTSSMRKYIEIDTTIKAGNSGGPALFENKVVGMCTHGDHTLANNINRVLSIETILEFIEEVKIKLVH